jgi:hypothetical protein
MDELHVHNAMSKPTAHPPFPPLCCCYYGWTTRNDHQGTTTTSRVTPLPEATRPAKIIVVDQPPRCEALATGMCGALEIVDDLVHSTGLMA